MSADASPSQPRRPALSLRDERGDASLIVALLLVALAGAYAAAHSSALVNLIRSAQKDRASDAATLGNVSNVTVMVPLFQFPVGVPFSASQPQAVPALYPSPYLANGKANASATIEALQPSTTASPWKLASAKALDLYGYDPRFFSGGTSDHVFSGGSAGPPAAAGNVHSTLTLKSVVVDPKNPQLIAKLVFASDATAPITRSVAAAVGHNKLTVEIPVPPPPPPECAIVDANGAPLASGGVLNSTPLTPGQTFTVSLHCFGITSQVTFGGKALALPPEANDIANTKNGGFTLPVPLGPLAANNPANGYAGPWKNAATDYGYMVFTFQVSGPGGPTTATVYVSVYNPVTCTFADENGRALAPQGGVFNTAPYPINQALKLTLFGTGYATKASFQGNAVSPMPTAATNLAQAGSYTIGAFGDTTANPQSGWPFTWEVDPASPSTDGFMVFTGTVAGPGNAPPGSAAKCDARVKVYLPPTCSFTQATYGVGDPNACTTLTTYQTGGGPASGAQILDPVSGPQSGTSDNFCPAGHQNFYAGIPGAMWGPGGRGTCSTNVSVNRPLCLQWETGQYVPLGACTLQCAPLQVAGSTVCPVTGLWTIFSAWESDWKYCDGISFANATCTVAVGPRHGGCFAADTRITLADGSTKRVDDLSSDDLILDPVRHAPVRIKSLVKGPEAPDLVEISAGGATLKVTTKHPMITREGLKPAVALESSDWLLGADGGFHPVASIRRVPSWGADVWNFETDAGGGDPAGDVEGRFVVANGIVTGDLTMQKALQRSSAR